MSTRFAPVSPGDRTVTTLCRRCEQGCGLEVSLGPDGRPVRVKGDKRHPYSRGWLCVKGLAALDFFASPRRLTTPLIRQGDGRLQPASWEEALVGRPANCIVSGKPTVLRAWRSTTERVYGTRRSSPT